MIHRFILLALLALVSCQDLFGPRAVHFPLQRRGGPFAPNRTADLDWLLEQLHLAESRFNYTQREVRGNKIVRTPKSKAVGGATGENLIGEIGKWGSWFAKLRVGASKQPIETDIDMLTADFALRSASSKVGTRFDEFFSSTYSVDRLRHPFTNCLYPKDQISFPTINQPVWIDFPHCRPPQQSRDVLLPSGAIWGLAPSSSLRQMDGVNGIVQQLIENNIIETDVFSIALLNGHEGLLSVGGTVAESIAIIEDRIERFLGKPAEQPVAMEVQDTAQDIIDAASGAPLDLVNLPGPSPADLDSLAGLDAPQLPLGADGEAVLMPAQAPLQGLPPASSDETSGEAAPEGPAAPESPVLRKRSLGKRAAPFEDAAAAASSPNPAHVLKRRDLSERVDPVLRRAGRPGRAEHNVLPSWRDAWKWSPVEGAAGWWQTLMRGVWVDQSKVLKNQPVVVDLATPFILAPPLAAKAFYASISGTRRLPKPYHNFYAFPCNNPPFLHVEFSGWRFPVMRGSKSMTGGGPDGKFSLGKVSESSGYCVGAVVETRMGVGDQGPVRRRSVKKADSLRGMGAYDSGMLAGNGMRDVWVLGEPAFRGLGIVFDAKNKEIGFRTY